MLASGVLSLMLARHRGVNPFDWRRVSLAICESDRDPGSWWNAKDRRASLDFDREGGRRLFHDASAKRARISPWQAPAHTSSRASGL